MSDDIAAQMHAKEVPAYYLTQVKNAGCPADDGDGGKNTLTENFCCFLSANPTPRRGRNPPRSTPETQASGMVRAICA